MRDATVPVHSEATRRLGVLWAGGLMAFAAFLGLLAILERIGLPQGLIPPLVFGPILLVLAGLGVAMRTMLLSEFDVAGRTMPLPANAVATATVLAGLVLSGADPVVTGMGAAAGLFAAGLIVAPGLHASGAATLPEFFGRRHGRAARAAAAIITLASCLPAAVALLTSAVAGMAQTLAMTPSQSLLVAAIVLGCASVLGGLRGTSAASLAAGAMVVIAAAVASIFVFAGEPGRPLARVTTLSSREDVLILALAAMAGTIGLPPLGQRFASGASPRQARRAAQWAALFVVVVAFVIPIPSFDRAAILTGSVVGGSLLAGAAVAAMLAAATAFVFATANTLSNDVHRAVLGRRGHAAASRQLIVARLLVIAVIVGACRLSVETATAPRILIAWSLTLAAAGLAPVLLVGTAMRIGGLSATAGMAAGTAVAMLHLVGGAYDPMRGFPPVVAGLGGATAGIVVTATAAVGVLLARRVWSRWRAAKPAPVEPAAAELETAAVVAEPVAAAAVEPAAASVVEEPVAAAAEEPVAAAEELAAAATVEEPEKPKQRKRGKKKKGRKGHATAASSGEKEK